MATIKVFSADGVRELQCFDTLDNVPYLEDPSSESDEDLEDEQ